MMGDSSGSVRGSDVTSSGRSRKAFELHVVMNMCVEIWRNKSRIKLEIIV